MSQRLIDPSKPRGLTAQTIRIWGLIFLIAGVVGRAILERKLLGLVAPDFDQIMEVLNTSDAYFKIATGAIILQILQTCAVPLFAFLLVEGAKRTKCYWKYFLRVLGVALISEVPYDLVYGKGWLDFSTQNPALGLVVVLIVLFLFKSYSGKGVKTVFVYVVTVLVATMWADMLRIDEGVPMLMIATAMWLTRNKKGAQVFAGAIVTCLCSTLSAGALRYFLAPIACLLIHFYNEEPGEGNRVINYAAYPAILLGAWLFARFAF